jgi:hypothetical protein
MATQAGNATCGPKSEERQPPERAASSTSGFPEHGLGGLPVRWHLQGGMSLRLAIES